MRTICISTRRLDIACGTADRLFICTALNLPVPGARDAMRRAVERTLHPSAVQGVWNAEPGFDEQGFMFISEGGHVEGLLCVDTCVGMYSMSVRYRALQP